MAKSVSKAAPKSTTEASPKTEPKLKAKSALKKARVVRKHLTIPNSSLDDVLALTA